MKRSVELIVFDHDMLLGDTIFRQQLQKKKNQLEDRKLKLDKPKI